MTLPSLHPVILCGGSGIRLWPLSRASYPKNPINPYGHTKLMIEQALADYDHAYSLKSVLLRYFNAAGTHPEGILGEQYDPETHLIPLVLQAASGKRPHITVFGSDYDTPDGTCIRDDFQVLDLPEAHLLALQHLAQGGAGAAFNLCNGTGHSVQQVIDAAQRVTSRPVPVLQGERRAGDPARLVADSRAIQQQLGWTPRIPELERIVRDAWNHHTHSA